MTSYDDLWSSLPVPALIVAQDDRIADVNAAAEEFLNVSRKSLLESPVWDRLMVDAPMDAALERARADGVPLFVNDVDVGSGSRPPLQCNIQIAPMGRRGPEMLVLVQPREMAGRVTRNSSAKTAAKSAIGMAEMLAHEIKNPLAGITGAAQLLSMNLSADDLELTDLIVAETRRVVKLLEQVEQFGDVSMPNLQPVNIHDVLDRARKSAAVGFGAHMTFIEDYDPSLPPTLGDSDQLTQVLLNLLKNASEASKGAPGTIRIRTYYEQSLRLRRQDGTGRSLPLQIEIIDDGPGLPDDIASNIFEPFVSGRENGTGLGLALVSKIITDHDGWISVESVPGRTSFRLSLPVATA
ncbi:two-component system sensor histidine kinase NtrB [Shimia ponticola]|uniref:two-component system sensor histidine kinase NtrB n=1 Tax=Shimia ponticola TaxID=2582893 RepID=UPI0011BE0F1D|nr:ATP-binding protein [Shimia ponticola]